MAALGGKATLAMLRFSDIWGGAMKTGRPERCSPKQSGSYMSKTRPLRTALMFAAWTLFPLRPFAQERATFDSSSLVEKAFVSAKSGHLLDWSFYDEKSLKEFCGCDHVVTSDITSGTRYYLSAFPNDLKPWNTGLPPRAAISVIESKSANKIQNARIDINFQGASVLLTSSAITRVLGDGWVEDRRAEEDQYMAIAREPFNPPAKTQHILRYNFRDTTRAMTGSLTLNFGDSDQLYDLTVSVETAKPN